MPPVAAEHGTSVRDQKRPYRREHFNGIWYIQVMGHTDPWQAFAARHREEERIVGPITKTTDFGVFVGLEGGIDGIVHLSDISWSEPGEAAIRRFAEGDVVEVMILSIDIERQRVSLGIKQIDNPYELFADRYAVGDSVVGRVREIDFPKLIVDLTGNLTGIVRLGRSTFSGGRSRFAVGDELALVISEIWPRHGVIELRCDDDHDDASPLPVEPGTPPSPNPIASSRRR